MVDAVEAKVFADESLRVLVRGIGDAKRFEANPSLAIGYALRSMSGNHQFAPMLLVSRLNSATKTNKWHISGGPDVSTPDQGPL